MAKKRIELLDPENIEFKNYSFVQDENGKPFLLGEGGSGIVYKVDQIFVENVKTERAVKFFIFKDDLIEKLDTYISASNFDDEILNISKFNHQNILKIIDGGRIKRDNLEIPYIVSDFIAGETLEDLLSNPDLIKKYFDKKERIFDLFLQILDGLIYLHNRNFYHCDIAPKNIFINLSMEGFYVIIGDLGVGKTISENENSEDQILVTGTRAFMPLEVSTLKDTKISIDEFKKLQPKWDIHSVKLTFIECIEKIFNISIKDKIELPWLFALVSNINKKHTTLSSLHKNIERINPIHRIIAGLPELSESDSGSRRKLLPLNDVLITERVGKIIDHPTLLRLKLVPQLLMGSTIFPGSNHTRYEHALGTYENMRKVLIGLLKKDKFIDFFTQDLLELSLVSSLLSNITRFPYSFAIHELRNSDKTILPNINQRNIFQLALDYKEKDTGFDYSLKETIIKFFSNTDLDIVQSIICGSKSGFSDPEIQLINSILNSSIDVRVLDFLQRDSYHLGMSNGFQFDLDSLITFLDIHNNKIAISSPGVSTVEQIISARYWLYKNIYWNEPNRSYTAILKQILYELSKHKIFENIILENFLFSDPKELLNLFCNLEFADKKVKNLIYLITKKRPQIFRRIYLINKSEEDSVLSGICDKISNLRFSELDSLRIELERELQSLIAFDKDKINILIDIPSEENTKLGKDINVIKYDKNITKLTDMSGIVSGINNYFDSHLQWLRIYVNPEYKEILKTEGISKKIEDKIKKFLVKRLG